MIDGYKNTEWIRRDLTAKQTPIAILQDTQIYLSTIEQVIRQLKQFRSRHEAIFRTQRLVALQVYQEDLLEQEIQWRAFLQQVNMK